MKKYSIYMLPLSLCLLVAMMLGFGSQKNHQSLGLRTTKDMESAVLGDVNVIKTLRYRFYISDDKTSWKVQGKGNTMTLSYEAKPYRQLSAKASLMKDQMGIDYHKAMRLQAVYKENMEQALRKKASGTNEEEVGTYPYVTLQLVNYKGNVMKDKQGKPWQFQVKAKKKDGLLLEYYRDANSLNVRTSKRYTKCDTLAYKKYGESSYMDEEGYFFIGPQELDDLNAEEVSFQQNPGGIYHYTKDYVEKLADIPYGEEDIISMTRSERYLSVLLRKEKQLVLRQYTVQGKVLDEAIIDTDFNSLADVYAVYDSQGHLICIKSPLYDFQNTFTAYVYDMEKDKLKLMHTGQAVVEQTSNLYEKAQLAYDKGIVYSLQLCKNKLRIAAADKEKIRYQSEVYGDFQDDEALPALEEPKQNAYALLVWQLLSNDHRRIYDAAFLGIK